MKRERERGDVSAAVTGNADRYYQTWIGIPKSECQEETGLVQTGELTDYDYDKMNRVYSEEGISPVVETPTGGGQDAEDRVDSGSESRNNSMAQWSER